MEQSVLTSQHNSLLEESLMESSIERPVLRAKQVDLELDNSFVDRVAKNDTKVKRTSIKIIDKKKFMLY